MPAESMTEYSTFEGLFVRGLKIDDAFSEQLRVIGVNLKEPQPRYPTRVWRQALDLAQRRYFANLPPAQGRRALGGVAIEGFLSTISGRFIGAVLSTVVSPEAFVKRLPRFFQMARPGIEVTVEPVAERHWRAVWNDAFPDPEFNCGLIEPAGRKTSSSFVAEVVRSGPAGFELSIRW